MKRKRILFVCTGNTCRSPMAELLLRSKIKKSKIKWWDVSSCGIHADVGSPISHNAKAVLKEVGIASDGFTSKQLTQKKIASSALVICMTSTQKQMLEDCGNVKCMSNFCGYEIPDPYGCDEGVYRLTRDKISEACDRIIENFILRYKE
ncbi:MAG: hypothetical protein NC489_32790 [Ruminococcus flavefaciens]|nr:hypothetical protein [Ruminococcus flavefaciens]